MFLINLNIGVARIFDWGEGGPNMQQVRHQKFSKKLFWVKDTVEVGSEAGAWAARNRDFAKRENLNLKLIFFIKNV